MRAKKASFGCGWSLLFVFAFVWLHALRPPASETQPVATLRSGSQVYPLSESAQSALFERAWASPSVQAVLGRLNQLGWKRVDGQEKALAFERAQILVLRFTKDSQPSRPIPMNTREPVPKTTVDNSPPAFLVYALLPEGEDVFAVLREDQDSRTFFHIYPDTERRFICFNGGEQLLAELRKNERFRKFEKWLKQHVERILCGPAFVDEVTNIAYIFVSGLVSTLSVQNLPAIYPPPSSYQEMETYIVLADVVSRAQESVTLDPESVWVLPWGKAEAFTHSSEGFSSAGLKWGEVGPYKILAGGRQPGKWPDLRSFGYLYELDLADAEPMSDEVTMPSRGSPRSEPPQPIKPNLWGLTAFLWRLADYPEENIIFRFKTDAELTLEAYNLAVERGLPASLGVYSDPDKPHMALVGLGSLTYDRVKTIYENLPEEIVRVDRDYIVLPIRGLQCLFEDITKVPLEDVALALYKLALADEEGRFEEAYTELLSQGLSALETLFDIVTFSLYRAHYKLLIRDLALKWRKEVDSRSQTISPQALVGAQSVPLPPGLNLIFTILLGEFVSRIVDALISAVNGEKQIIKRVKWTETEVEISTTEGVKTIGVVVITELEKWVSQIEPPPPYFYANDWSQWLWRMLSRAQMKGLSKGLPEYSPIGLGLIVLWLEVYALQYDSYMQQKMRSIVEYLMNLTVTMNYAEGRGFKLAGVAWDQDWRALALYKRETSNRITIDYACVKYTERLDEKTLNWANTALNKLLEMDKDAKDKGYPNSPDKPYEMWRGGQRSGTIFSWDAAYGVDVVAIVITEELTTSEVQELLEEIKNHSLYDLYTKGKQALKSPRQQDEYASIAFVVTWKNKDTDTLEYAWLDYGRDETPQEVREQIVLAINGVPRDMKVQVKEVDINKASPPQYMAIYGGGGGWESRGPDNCHLLLGIPIN